METAKHLPLLWEESPGTGEVNISRTAPTEAGMGKGPFLRDEVELELFTRTPTWTDCFTCELPRQPWRFTAGNFLWMPHSFHFSLTPHLPPLCLISPALFYSLPCSFHLQVSLHQPRNWETNRIFFSYFYAFFLSFLRCTTPNADTPPKKIILGQKN